MRREDEQEKTYFRSTDRVFNLNGGWYFSTREGEVGPFATEQQAQFEIARFITEKTDLALFQNHREEKLKTSVRAEVYEFKGRPYAPAKHVTRPRAEVLI
jgi:hypothetical protein